MSEMLLHELEAEKRAEQQRALRGLLRRPLLGSADNPIVFSLVRKHESELRAKVLDLLGYRLAVHADHARLFRQGWRRDDTRPATVPKKRRDGGNSEPADRWPAFNRRHYLLLFLALAVLEDSHSRVQMPLSELADEISQLSREMGIATDFDERSERLLLGDVIEWMRHWHVVDISEGEHSRDYVDDSRGGDCLLTVDHSRLGSLLAPNRALIDAGSVEDLLSDGDYPPTDEGRRSRIRHRLARRLVEDPVVYVDDLDDEERPYFVAQRPTNLSAAIEQATGLRPEHRSEGTAFIDPERELTDLRFPERGFDRQLPLLLCRFLSYRIEIGQPEISRGELRVQVRDLIEQHQHYWAANAKSPDAIESALDHATGLLERMRLVSRVDGNVRALPAVARYRDPVVRHQKEQTA